MQNFRPHPHLLTQDLLAERDPQVICVHVKISEAQRYISFNPHNKHTRYLLLFTDREVEAQRGSITIVYRKDQTHSSCSVNTCGRKDGRETGRKERLG